MKKIFYLFAIITLVFTSCEPLEDVYNANPLDNNILAVEAYTFITEDYELYKTELNDEEFFESQDQADLLIPGFLITKFPVYGEGSLVNVNYNLFDETVLEMTTTSETLSNIIDIDAFLSSNMESASNGTFVGLTYNAEVLGYELTDNDFVTIEGALGSKYPQATASASRFGNFERRELNNAFWSDNMIVEALTILLASDYNTGQVLAVSFPIYDGSSGSESFTLQHNGYSFLKLDAQVIAVTGTDYTLTEADYDAIATGLIAEYPVPAANLESFKNFNRLESSDNFWNDEMLVEAFNLVLPTIATEGDIYAVSYDVYNGNRATETMTLIYTAGAYAQNVTVVEVSTVIAKNDGDWEFPYAFTKSDYYSLGFADDRSNFSNSNIYMLDIFLEDIFPFAQAGDVATVQYKFYSGSTSTKYGKSIFDGNNWKLTTDIIETSFQYGIEDGIWIPDNTISYTFLAADIDLISNYFISIYPGPADNVGFFGSFDRRDSSGNFWNDEMLLEAFNVLLDTRNPNAEEGQKYALTFVVYTGSTGSETKKVVKENGIWVYQ